jgi:peroxiredoxin
VQARADEIRSLGGEVLAISFTPPAKAAAYLQAHPLPFPVLADPDRAGYRAFELGRTSWLAMLRPRFVVRYAKVLLRGGKPLRPLEDEDVLQLGGDFVLDAGRRLVYAYRSADPADRPAAEELVQAARKAGGGAA